MSSSDMAAPSAEADQGAPALLEARGVSKLYGTFPANDQIDFQIQPGEIHALLGENGAGKSTLVKMIYGVAQPSAGGFFWRGAPYAPADPAAARTRGVGMVFQHFSLFNALTVLENIALALPPQPMGAMRAQVADLSKRYGLTVDPDRPAHALSAGEKQRVEILRCLLQTPDLLIMDEPTSVLTPQEAERLFEVLRTLKSEGKAVLYISHRLEEIRDLCDRAAVLRRGRIVADCDPRVETPKTLAEMMVGSGVDWVRRTPAIPSANMDADPAADAATAANTDANAAPEPQNAALLQLNRLSLPAGSPTAVALHNISLTVRPGEIVGVAGVAGEGQSELMDALSGEIRAPQAEMIEIDGQAVGRRGVTARRRLGAGFCPEERNGHAAVGSMPLTENALLSLHNAEGLARGGLIRPRLMRDWTRRIVEAFDVRGDGADPLASSLSGGNLQKFVVGRELTRDLRLFVVSQPTWGVDAGAASAIRKALIALADRGGAVLMISQDLEEIFALSDRIAALHRGHLSPAYFAADMTPEKIGLLMGGEALEDAA